MPDRVAPAGAAEREAKLNAIGETVERVEHRCRADEPEALVIDFPNGSLIATIDDSIGMLVLEWMPPSARRQLRMYRATIGRMYEPPRRFEGFRVAGDAGEVPDGIMAGETPLSGVRLFDFKMGFEGGPDTPAAIPLTYTAEDEWRGYGRRRAWWDPRGWPARVWAYLRGDDVLPPRADFAAFLNDKIRERVTGADEVVDTRTIRLGDEDVTVAVTRRLLDAVRACICDPYDDIGPYGHEEGCPAYDVSQADYNATRKYMREHGLLTGQQAAEVAGLASIFEKASYRVGQYGAVQSFTVEPAEEREERKRDDGSPMGREELRELLIEHFTCGCGDPGAVAELVYKLLSLAPFYEAASEQALEELLPDQAVQYLVLHVLDSAGVTEHGGHIGGSWLTDKGKAMLAALAAAGDLDALFDDEEEQT